jgi:hypothetical protein
MKKKAWEIASTIINQIQLIQLRLRLKKLTPLSSFKKHGYIVASSGSWKSELIKALILPELLHKQPKNAVVIIDPHGDMAEEIAQFKLFNKANINKRLVFIDPTLHDGYSPSINPFAIIDRSEKSIAIMTQELKSIIAVLLEWSNTSHQMDAILSPCIATLLRRENSSFIDLQRFMDDQNNHDLVELGKQSPNPQHRQLFQTKFNTRFYDPTKHGLYTRMQILLNDPIFQNLISNRTTVDLKQLIEQKSIIVFKLSLGEVGTESVQAFWRFIVGILRITAIQRSNIAINKRVPTYVFIDEFQHFITDDIEKSLTQLRKYGLHLILSNQYIGQGIKSSLQKVLFWSGIKLVGQNDLKSIKTIANELEIPVTKLKNLAVGEFYLKLWVKPAYKIKSSKLLLKNNFSMKSQHWQKIKQSNLKNYYAQLSQSSYPIANHVQSVSSLESLTAKYGNWWS